MTLLVHFTKRKRCKFFFRRKILYYMELSFQTCIWKEFQKFWCINYHRQITQNAARFNESAIWTRNLMRKGYLRWFPLLSMHNLNCPQLLLSNRILHFILMFGSRRLSPQKNSMTKTLTYSRCWGTATLWCLRSMETVVKARAERLEMIVESLRVEKTSKFIKSNHQSSTTTRFTIKLCQVP